MVANTTFASLKKNRKSNFDKLNEELKKATSTKTDFKKDDDRIWYPDTDKVGNGFAVIRFLPAPEGEDVPFVRLFSHGFQGPTGTWYIENSLTTLGLPDPASEYNSKLWNSGIESDKDVARKQKRKLQYFSNIYVIKDGAKPENEGKVFLFRYGKKIFDKLYEASNPPLKDDGTPVDPDVKAIDPFDLWEGANFKLKIRQVAGYRNYDTSVFDAQSKLFADDGKLEKIWKQAHSLKAFIDPKEFKTYDELKAKLYRTLALGNDGEQGLTNQLGGKESDLGWREPPKRKTVAPKEEAEVEAEVEGDEDDLSFFKRIADDGEEALLD